ncbi:MAG TPA: HIT domain-containing protein [Candidatus Levybacteria bacterium]|nr:HIT domain-containing protein [Candidatus Levybacteria bacterium]
MQDCIFCKIVSGQMETTFLYEDDQVVAFKDVHPQKPVHLLVIPKEHIKEFSLLEEDAVLVSVRKAIQTLILENKLQDDGYRIEVNGGGAQLVDHLHFHLLGPMSKPVV